MNNILLNKYDIFYLIFYLYINEIYLINSLRFLLVIVLLIIFMKNIVFIIKILYLYIYNFFFRVNFIRANSLAYYLNYNLHDYSLKFVVI